MELLFRKNFLPTPLFKNLCAEKAVIFGLYLTKQTNSTAEILLQNLTFCHLLRKFLVFDGNV